jgi:hypothetical protein
MTNLADMTIGRHLREGLMIQQTEQDFLPLIVAFCALAV